MESFAPTSSQFWTAYRFTPHTVDALPTPKSFHAYLSMKALDASGTMFLETTLTPDARTAITSSTHIGHVRNAAANEITAHTVAQPLVSLRSSYHTTLAAVGTGVLTVLRTDDGWSAGDKQKFLTLSFPADGMPGIGRTVVFDDVYGVALAFARGRLFVIQY
jgi:hypothetical protein